MIIFKCILNDAKSETFKKAKPALGLFSQNTNKLHKQSKNYTKITSNARLFKDGYYFCPLATRNTWLLHSTIQQKLQFSIYYMITFKNR